MDIGRTMLPNFSPRHRLDAGTFGTMGVGLGFAIAAAAWARDHAPDSPVLCVQGDSAFGFAGMELETAVRHRLPIVLVVINNNGIYQGLDKDVFADIEDVATSAPPTSLLPEARYDLMAAALGAAAFLCRSQDEVRTAYAAALKETNRPSVINVLISPSSERKPQEFQWLTRSKV